jgi:hypothetical protein
METWQRQEMRTVNESVLLGGDEQALNQAESHKRR